LLGCCVVCVVRRCLLLCVHCSDYRLNLTDVTSDVVSGPIGDQAVTALWQLSLALIFKMIVTIFTFGLKVCLTISLMLSHCHCHYYQTLDR